MINQYSSPNEAFIAAIKGKRRLDAIKCYRQLTGLGLKESKDAVDVMIPYEPAPWQTAVADLTAAATPKVAEYVTLHSPDADDFKPEWGEAYRGSNRITAFNRARGVANDYPDNDVIVVRIVAMTKTVVTTTLTEV